MVEGEQEGSAGDGRADAFLVALDNAKQPPNLTVEFLHSSIKLLDSGLEAVPVNAGLAGDEAAESRTCVIGDAASAAVKGILVRISYSSSESLKLIMRFCGLQTAIRSSLRNKKLLARRKHAGEAEIGPKRPRPCEGRSPEGRDDGWNGRD